MALQEIVAQTVSGLGYDLVEVERSAGGLLRITIDLPWTPPAANAPVEALGEAQFVTVEDCEKVTRQLQFALEVDGVEYRRLEVSSPGIDRPLRHQADFERFCGQVIDITLKAPMGAAANGQVNANRKKFRGTLERASQAAEQSAVTGAEEAHAANKAAAGGEAGQEGWQIVWSDEPPVKPGQRVSKKRVPPPLQVLGFVLDELREARLAPIVSFKGRGGAADE